MLGEMQPPKCSYELSCLKCFVGRFVLYWPLYFLRERGDQRRWAERGRKEYARG